MGNSEVRLIYWHLHALLWLETAWHITRNYWTAADVWKVTE